MTYTANNNRYETMSYNNCGKWGLKLSAISLGLWHNFGDCDSYENGRNMITTAFDLGITHFDLANNYGPNPGSAEEFMGKILKKEMSPYRDEMVISSKAGYHMWNGPYGDGGSRKYLISSLDQSLRRMGLEYVDIFYHHRPDTTTPIEESMMALHQIVTSGKALYVGLSNYRPDDARTAIDILEDLGTPCLIHQPRYSMMDRWVEDGLTDVLDEKGVGMIPFSPLNKGILTNKYLKGIPADSRAASKNSPFLSANDITPELVSQIKQLNTIAQKREQSIAQMALAWNLNNKTTTSVLIGASKPSQITNCVQALDNITFSPEELKAIDSILGY